MASLRRVLVDFATPGTKHRYGRARSQTGELRLPRSRGPHPVAVVIHGGYWRARYSRRITRPIAADLTRRGWATWNIEYRRIGRGQGGGWPATFEDVASAFDVLADLGSPTLDLDRVVAIGHSAGGHLALWAATRSRLPADAPGADPRVHPIAVAALAAVTDLEASASLTFPGEPVHQLVGGTPAEFPARFALANPRRRLPLGVPVLLVHGEGDETVPLSRSRDFAAALREAGDSVELVELPVVDHRAVVDPRTPAWARTAEHLARLPGAPIAARIAA